MRSDVKINLDEFMFGFQWLFKSKDQHQSEYVLAAALWSVFLERANELPPSIGVNTDVCVKYVLCMCTARVFL